MDNNKVVFRFSGQWDKERLTVFYTNLFFTPRVIGGMIIAITVILQEDVQFISILLK